MQFPFTVVVEPPSRAALASAVRSPWLWLGAALVVAAAAAAVVLLPVVGVLPRASPRLGDPGAATLRLTSDPPGAAVELDGRTAGRTPLEVAAAPGEHTVRFRLGGRADATRRLAVAAGETHGVAAELWLSGPAARRLRPTFPGAVVADASFLADGRVALTVALPPDQERQLWLLDNSGAAQRVGPPVAASTLAVAPDGRRFAYLARAHDVGARVAPVDGRANELWVGERDGDRGRRVYALPPPAAAEQLVDLAWSPDGQHLVVVSRVALSGGGIRSRLLWLDAARGDARELALLPSEVVAGSYAWSPDGRRFAFLARAGRATSLCLAGGEEAGIRYLADLSRDDPSPLPFTPLSWSADGSRVVYAAPVDDRSNSGGWLFGPRTVVGLFGAPADAPAGQRIGAAEGQSPVWRRDGALLALARPTGGGPLVVRAYGADGEAETLATLPVRGAAVYAARWDTAHAQAIVALRGDAGFGASRPDFWLVRFAEEAGR